MNFNVIGLHPDNALKIALDIFDNKASAKDKIKLLLNNRPIKDLNSIDIPVNFSSGKTIDINVSELLGLGCVTSYYNWTNRESGKLNTYQAVVGIEDQYKREIETLLSDGAIWHDQTKKKILVQQVMTQGYYPQKEISNFDVVYAVKKKIKQRNSYPENCVLIVNAFGDDIAIDRQKIYDEINNLTDAFTDVYLIIYDLPLLTMANVSYVSEHDVRGLTMGLKRYDNEKNDEWSFSLGSN